MRLLPLLSTILPFLSLIAASPTTHTRPQVRSRMNQKLTPRQVQQAQAKNLSARLHHSTGGAAGGSALTRALVSRQLGPVLTPPNLGLTLCVTLDAAVDLKLPNLLGGVLNTGSVQLDEGLCLCAEAGILTQASVAQLNVDLVNQLSALADLLNSVVGVNISPLQLVVDGVLVLLGQEQAQSQCGPYPAGSSPICGSCDFTCPTPQVPCNRLCVAPGTSCPSPLPVGGGGSGRRNLHPRVFDVDMLCPQGFSACGLATPSGSLQSAFGMATGQGKGRGRFECLDTSKDVESCGGCQFPLPGKRAGTDCTALENTDIVACVQGQCVVESCKAGFELWGEDCIRA